MGAPEQERDAHGDDPEDASYVRELCEQRRRARVDEQLTQAQKRGKREA